MANMMSALEPEARQLSGHFAGIVGELQELVEHLEGSDTEREDASSETSLDAAVDAKLTTALANIRSAEKQIHTEIAKRSKELSSIDVRPIIQPTPSSKQLLETAIFRHLLHLGLYKAAKTLDTESPALRDQEQDLKTQLSSYETLDEILNALDNGDISLALKWAGNHLSFLIKAHSALIHDLYCFQLACFAKKGRLDALAFLRDIGPSVFSHNGRGIPLMLLGNMPQDFGSRARDSFKWAYLCQTGGSHVSQLDLAVKAGLVAFPQLARSYAVMRARNAEWSSSDELPVEISLSQELRFHPIFVCPVSKEQTSSTNPAQLLPCGHVLSKSTVQSLRNEGLSKRVIKCPYCPESATVDTLESIVFAGE